MLVERTGFSFCVKLEYENLPEFFSFSNCICHVVVHYNKKSLEVKPVGDKQGPRNKIVLPKTYVQLGNKGKNMVLKPDT